MQIKILLASESQSLYPSVLKQKRQAQQNMSKMAPILQTVAYFIGDANKQQVQCTDQLQSQNEE
jgi:hypothetical protein